MPPDTLRGRPRRWDRWGLGALVLLAWALRLALGRDSRFHPDEALYGTWGLLIAHGRDPLLAGVPVYKPALLPYLVAAAQGLVGTSEFSVRLPGLVGGTLLVPLVAALAHSLYRDERATLVAALAAALSSFAIFFSTTAFTDPVMVTLGIGACAAAARRRMGWAGVLGGLAFATKQTGLVWVPLALVIGLVQGAHTRSRDGERASPGAWVCTSRLVLGYLPVVGLLLAWDAARRAQGAEGFWSLGISGYGGLRLIWPGEVTGRLRGWWAEARRLFASPVVNGALLLGLPCLVWRALVRRPRRRESLVDLLFVSFTVVYFLLHWLWAFPVWDRYLLPLLPILAVLLGRVVAVGLSGLWAWRRRVAHLVSRRLSSIVHCSLPVDHRPLPHSSSPHSSSPHCSLFHLSLPRFSLIIVHCSLIIALTLPVYDALRRGHPSDGARAAYKGIDQVAVFLGDLPEGTVVYQHWLGWEYGYYLFDAPLYLAYWPDLAWLAEDVLVFGAADPRYIVFPSWESPARVEWALARVGFGLESVLATTYHDGTPSFTVYRVWALGK